MAASKEPSHDDDNKTKHEKEATSASPKDKSTTTTTTTVMTRDPSWSLQNLQSSLAIVSKELQEDVFQYQQEQPNWKASAVGGLMSLAQDVAIHAVTKNKNNNKNAQSNVNNNNNSNMWDKAIAAAQTSAKVHQQERAFHASDVTINYLVGDVSKAKNIGLVIHGFMTAKEENVESQWVEWAATLDMVLYRVCWPTGSMDGWKSFADKTVKGNGSNNNNNNNKKQLNLLSKINSDWATQLTSNPWHVAQDKTVQVGTVLAKFLERQLADPDSLLQHYQNNGGSISLIGHSLGGAIVFQTLLQSTATAVQVDYAICLGGAFVPNKEKIQRALKCVKYKLINIYSKHDQVLQKLFRAANINIHPAAGTIPLLVHFQITDKESRTHMMDLDMTTRIPPKDPITNHGHSYAQVFPWIAETIQPILLSMGATDNNNNAIVPALVEPTA